MTSYLLELAFGDVVPFGSGPLSAKFISAIDFMTLLQYVTNFGIVAICAALQAERPMWQTWKTHYLWTSFSYFAGASAAALIAKLIIQFGFYALAIAIPIIAIVFFTYRIYQEHRDFGVPGRAVPTAR